MHVNKNFSRREVLLSAAASAAALSLAGCAGQGASGSDSESTKSDHEPITITTFGTNYENFEAALKKAYPEVNLEFVSYAGKNSTQYAYSQLEVGQTSDIYSVSVPPYNKQLQIDGLLDVSAEDFVTNLNLNLISNVTIDGAVYMVPSNANFFGMYYNKTLFEKHGWSVPTSLNELEELIPQINAAGVTVSQANAQYPGNCFAYFFDSIAPDFLTTLEGQTWVEEFLAGNATAVGNLDEYAAAFKRLVDLGMFHVDGNEDAETSARFKEGNTAFMCTNTVFGFHQNDDGTGDEYGIMPYLSTDGSNNIIVTKVNFYYGISKALEGEGQKLEDAKKVLSFIATAEGQESLNNYANTYSPLKDEGVSEDSPLYEVAKMVDEGKSMPLIYAGWEQNVVDIGELAQSFIKGEIATSDEFLRSMDAIQSDVIANGMPTYAKVEQDLDVDQVAQVVGAAFAKGVNAECALISMGAFHGFGRENSSGICAKIFANIALTQDVICTFDPLGWYGKINTVTLTGKQINEWIEAGFFVDGDDEPFEYKLVAPEGFKVEDAATYTVAVVAESEERATEGNLSETEVTGQDALKAYLKELGTLNEETIAWK